MNDEPADARRELERVKGELAEKNLLLSRLLDLSPSAIYIFDAAHGRYEYSNHQLSAILGISPGAISALGEDFLVSSMHPEDAGRFSRHRAALDEAKDREVLEFEGRIKDSYGSWRWMRVRDFVFDRDATGKPRRAVGIADDITEQKAREEELRSTSFFDELTGIRNRRGFEEYAKQHLHIASRQGNPCAFVYLDLDGFKTINDRFGHSGGDEVLRQVVSILVRNLRAGDVIARLGGDEFILLLVDIGEPSVKAFLERLSAKVNDWNGSSGKPWRIEFSAGYSVFNPSSPEVLRVLIDRADEARYAVKRKRNRGA